MKRILHLIIVRQQLIRRFKLGGKQLSIQEWESKFKAA